MLNTIFYEYENYEEKANWANKNNCTIIELESDEKGRRFKIVENVLSPKDFLSTRISELKRQIAKYKEDVEQVELFGMERSDYQEKKQMCANIILQLRQLENQLKEFSE